MLCKSISLELKSGYSSAADLDLEAIYIKQAAALPSTVSHAQLKLQFDKSIAGSERVHPGQATHMNLGFKTPQQLNA